MPPSYASVIAPLTNLTRPSVPFDWDVTCQRAFDRVKLLLTTTPVLVHPDFSLPFYIHCDASGKGIGGVLSQYVNGAYRPIAFCSKRLLPHQQHWSPAQLEAYAVYHCVCVKWRYYLSLNKTVVHSDHRNLAWLFNHAHKGMIGRWYAQLSAYDLDITYVSGKSQVTADPLSRILKATVLQIPPPSPSGSMVACRLAGLASVGRRSAWRGSHETESAWFKAMPAGLRTPDQRNWENLKNMISRQWHGARLARNIPRSVWASHQRKDPWLGPIYSCLSAKSTQAPTKSSARIQAIAQSFRLKQGVLHYRPVRALGVQTIDEDWVVAVPASLQGKVIQECHEDGVHGHLGVRKTVFAIRRRYYFRKLRSAVARYIQKCVPCIRAKSAVQPTDLPLQPFLSTIPFNAVSIDLYAPGTVLESGHKYVLTVVDLCTRWVQFIPIKSKLASEVLVNLCRHWFHFHGIPEFVLSDRGKEFMGVMATVCGLLGIKQIRTTPYHPQTNGLCEVQHKTLTRELRVRGQRKNAPTWADLLSEIQFAINISLADEAPHLSPFQLVFGRSPRLSAVDITFPSNTKVHVPTSEQLAQAHAQYLKQLTYMRFRALDNQIERKETSRRKWDKSRHPRRVTPLARGMLVHVQQPSKTLKKLTYQWSAPEYLLVNLHPPHMHGSPSRLCQGEGKPVSQRLCRQHIEGEVTR